MVWTGSDTWPWLAVAVAAPSPAPRPTDGARWDALVAVADRTVVGLDFDGTLAPIVEDPTTARIHPDAAEVLVDLAPHVAGIAVVTGRPTRQALDLGGLEEVGDAVAAAGTELVVLGQYGNERWSSSARRIVSPRPPHGLASLLRELPGTLRSAGLPDAWVEEKGLAVAVHTRRLPDPAAAQQRLTGPLADLAAAHGLVLEPGRHVVEVRGPGTDKGAAVRTLADELGAAGFLFAGDDLGDVPAFDAVRALAAAPDGLARWLVCSGSEEQDALVALADEVVDGPAGVLAVLRRLAVEAAARPGRPDREDRAGRQA